MRVHADRISVDGAHGTLVPSTTFTIGTGEYALIRGEPGVGSTAFGLALSGRLRLTSGTVTITDGYNLRDCSAIIDAPDVSEPDAAAPLKVVVGEELALAHQPAGKDDVNVWLAENDLAGEANTRFEAITAETRTRLLTTLAAHRKGVRLLILDTPDRHTSEGTWSTLASEHAAQGFAVVVLIATAPDAVLPSPAAHVGATEQPDPTARREPDTEAGQTDVEPDEQGGHK